MGSAIRAVGLKLHATKNGDKRSYHLSFLDYYTVRKMAGKYKARLASGSMLGMHIDDIDLDAGDLPPSGSLSPEMAEALIAEAMAA